LTSIVEKRISVYLLFFSRSLGCSSEFSEEHISRIIECSAVRDLRNGLRKGANKKEPVVEIIYFRLDQVLATASPRLSLFRLHQANNPMIANVNPGSDAPATGPGAGR